VSFILDSWQLFHPVHYIIVSIISLSFKHLFGVMGHENAKLHLIYSIKTPDTLKAIAAQFTLLVLLFLISKRSLSSQIQLRLLNICFCLFKGCIVGHTL